jgi:hypothetical protein
MIFSIHLNGILFSLIYCLFKFCQNPNYPIINIFIFNSFLQFFILAHLFIFLFIPKYFCNSKFIFLLPYSTPRPTLICLLKGLFLNQLFHFFLFSFITFHSLFLILHFLTPFSISYPYTLLLPFIFFPLLTILIHFSLIPLFPIILFFFSILLIVYSYPLIPPNLSLFILPFLLTLSLFSPILFYYLFLLNLFFYSILNLLLNLYFLSMNLINHLNSLFYFPSFLNFLFNILTYLLNLKKSQEKFNF